jgi:hypothetical protein
MKVVDWFKAMVSLTRKKQRKDKGRVFEESVKKVIDIIDDKIVKEVILDLNSISSPEVRKKELENYFTKTDKVVKARDHGEVPLNLLFGGVYVDNSYYTPEEQEDVDKAAIKLMKKHDSKLVSKAIELGLKHWKKLKKPNCLTIISKKTSDQTGRFRGLIYCLVQGEQSDGNDLVLYVKNNEAPCEGISIRELSNYEKHGSWLKIDSSVIRKASELPQEDAKKVKESLEGDDRFKTRGFDAGRFYVLSIGYDNRVELNHPSETYARHLIPFLKREITLYSCLVFFLISKAMKADNPLKIDLSKVKGELRT